MIASDRIKIHLLYAGLLGMALLTAHVLTSLDGGTAIKAAAGLVILVIAILKTEAALYILIFSMLLSPEIQVASAPGRPVVVRLDDVLLVILGISWLARTALFKEMGLFRKTALNRPIIYYALACVFSTALGALFGRVRPSTGFFYVVKYLEYFVVYFMVVNHLRDERQVRRFVAAMLFTGAKVSQFALLPQGQPERARRALAMVEAMDREGFGNCGNERECEAVCPKSISIRHIARLNREFIRARLTAP